MFYIIKIFVSACIITLVSEVAKRFPHTGGLIAAMPITTLLSMLWIYYENKDISLISNFLISVMAGTIISFIFFIAAIFLIKKGLNFYPVLIFSTIILGIAVFIYQKFFNVQL
jgi:predicted neutral ceramidase superfamily lipid hydrolase